MLTNRALSRTNPNSKANPRNTIGSLYQQTPIFAPWMGHAQSDSARATCEQGLPLLRPTSPKRERGSHLSVQAASGTLCVSLAASLWADIIQMSPQGEAGYPPAPKSNREV